MNIKYNLIIFSSFLFLLIACYNPSTTCEAEESKSATNPCKETIPTKGDIISKIQSFDINPLPYMAIEALKAGCKASTSNLQLFTEAFLCSIEARISLSTDLDIQNEIDNLEHIDTSDLNDSCKVVSLL